MIAGHATPEGTRTYRRRHAALDGLGHFRELGGLSCSSLGIGTYLGRDDPATDAAYTDAVLTALELGINVIDTAINYRNQRSERAIGDALESAISRGRIARDEVVIATKGGFLPFDGARPANARAYFDETYVRPGIMRWEDVVAGCHNMAPRYLRDQLARSRRNLRVATVDVYYLHNLEMQLDELPRGEFLRRVRAAFEALEDARKSGELRVYGTATWNGYRAPRGEPGRLELDELLEVARAAGGEDHGFRVVQLPLNYAMPEALDFLETAAGRVYVMTSASVLQGKLTRGLPPEVRSALDGLDTDAQRALQLVRSTPGVGTALVGMKSADHVRENVAVASRAPATEVAVARLWRQ